jgi:hypothetical protein
MFGRMTHSAPIPFPRVVLKVLIPDTKILKQIRVSLGVD